MSAADGSTTQTLASAPMAMRVPIAKARFATDDDEHSDGLVRYI